MATLRFSRVSKMKTLRASIMAMLRDGHTERDICATLRIRPCIIDYVIDTDSAPL